MQRTEATIRPTPYQGMRVHDIFHVWPDNFAMNGVKFASWLFVYLEDEPKDRRAVEVSLWLPGATAPQVRQLGWGQEWYTASPGFGMASVTAKGDAPLRVFWELTAGKA